MQSAPLSCHSMSSCTGRLVASGTAIVTRPVLPDQGRAVILLPFDSALTVKMGS